MTSPVDHQGRRHDEPDLRPNRKQAVTKVERGIHELFVSDPVRADELVWGRSTDPVSRRGFLKGSGLAAMSATIGTFIPFAGLMPQGLIPAALAQSSRDFQIPGKRGLLVMNDRPINAETPAHLLDDRITPAQHLFVRNNGTPPQMASIDKENWTLSVSGESAQREVTFSINQLMRLFEHHTYQLQLECGGNGRGEFVPSASGIQWSVGAIGCPEWTGVRLRDVLKYVGIRDDAVYVGYRGADVHLSGDPTKAPISRGVPIYKAMEDESLIAWAMNNEDIPHQNGYPLRLVCSGWPGSVSGKWLNAIMVRDREHDGEKMAGASYRIPCSPVAPGSTVPDDQMCIIESMPVKSLITFPQSGIEHPIDEPLAARGHAWAGDLSVAAVQTSIDFGATWQPAILEEPANRLAWQHWTTQVSFPEPGYYEVWVRATDTAGQSQPMVLPGWNPRGYLNNACHRVAILAV